MSDVKPDEYTPTLPHPWRYRALIIYLTVGCAAFLAVMGYRLWETFHG